MDSPFDVLRIDSDADEGEIEAAYRRRAKETHPDQGGSTEEFRRIRAAYEAITSDCRTGNWSAVEDGVGSEPKPTECRVEYLNYEILADYGWDVGDEDLFQKASAESLDPTNHGQFLVQPDESLLQAAENRGFAWPFACRGGACANCAVAITEGEMEMPVDHILPQEMLDRGIRLSCNGVPTTDEMKVVYNVKRMPDLDELRLPPHPFDRAHQND